MTGDPYTDFAETPALRMRIIELIMEAGEVSNAKALAIAARLHGAGFHIVPQGTRLSRNIAEYGAIPHMTQRLVP